MRHRPPWPDRRKAVIHRDRGLCVLCGSKGTHADPQHLQPISDRENVAEMHERNYYRNRITELENALRTVAPNHEALTENLARTMA